MNTTTPDNAASANESSVAQNELTYRIAVIGIGAVLLAFTLAVVFFSNSKNPGEIIPAVVGVVTAAVGTLVGAVAGHAAGAKGKEQAEQRASANERDAAAGRALAHTMIADQPLAPTAAAHERLAAPGLTQPQVNDIASRHAALARQLFPDIT